MDKGFISDTQVSQPLNSDKFVLDFNMNGFGWDTDHGMFIPIDEEINYFQTPFQHTEITVIPDA